MKNSYKNMVKAQRKHEKAEANEGLTMYYGMLVSPYRYEITKQNSRHNEMPTSGPVVADLVMLWFESEEEREVGIVRHLELVRSHILEQIADPMHY